MFEVNKNERPPELPIPELKGLSAVAQAILDEKPAYVLIPDTHVTAEAQNVSASLIEALTQLPTYKPGDIGFYVEALYDYAHPETGDFSGNVIAWDDCDMNEDDRTDYRNTIQKAINCSVPVYGIDLDKRVDSESAERMTHWKAQIDKGTEPIKILLIGAGHMWNDPNKVPDLMSKLGGNKVAILNEKAYIPPGQSKVMIAEISQSVPVKRKYNVVNYN